MAAEVGSAYVSLLPSAKGFGSALSRQVNKPVERAGREGGKRYGKVFATATISPLRAIGVAAVGLFAIDKVKDFFASSIGEAREAQKVGAITANVIKTTGGAAKVSAAQVGDLATAISNKTGIDDEAIQSGANLLLTFTNLRNETGKGNDVFNQATQAITDMGAAMGKDPKAAAIQLGKALNDPVKGVTALSRVGVSFTKQQKEQIATLVKSGNTLGAQKIILGEVRKEFGGTAAASATAGEKMSVAFGNFKEQVGTALLPIIDRFAKFMTSSVVPALSGFVSGLQNGSGAGGQFRAALQKIGAVIGPVIDTVKLFIGSITGAGADVRTMPWVHATIVAGAQVRTTFDQVIGVAKQAFDILFRGDFTGGPLSKNSQILDALSRLRDGLRALWTLVSTQVAPVLLSLGQAAFPVVVGALRTFFQVVGKVYGFMTRHSTLFTVLAATIAAGAAAFYAISAAVGIYNGVIKAIASATKIYTAIQAALNFVLTANPIGIVIVVVAALTAGIIVAYKRSETFRKIVDGAFRGVAAAGKFMWQSVLKPTFKFLVDAWFLVAGAIVHGAAEAFGWVPGLGPKLKSAAAKFDKFRDEVNASLAGVKDRKVKVSAYGYIGGSSKYAGKPLPLADGGPVPMTPGARRGRDSVPAVLMPDEFVVRRDGSNLADALKHYGWRGYANGGLVTRPYGTVGNLPSFPGKFNRAVDKRFLPAASKALEKSLGAIGGAVGGGGAVQRWAPVVARVLRELGQSLAFLPGVLRRIRFESGGNPNAINLTDSNARAGHPSRGLMQVIPGTFAAYGGRYRGLGITNPLANIYAGANYALHRYGSLGKIDPLVRPKGYDKGGILSPGDIGTNRLRQPERVLTPSNTKSFDQLVELLQSGGLRAGGGLGSGNTFYAYDPTDIVREQEKRARDAAAVYNLTGV